MGFSAHAHVEAAGLAFTTLEFGFGFVDAYFSGVWIFSRTNPSNPFPMGFWCAVEPELHGFFVGLKGSFNVFGDGWFWPIFR